MYYFNFDGYWFETNLRGLSEWGDHDNLNYYWEEAYWSSLNSDWDDWVGPSQMEFFLWAKTQGIELLSELPDAAYAAADEAMGSLSSSFASLLMGGTLHPEDPARGNL